MTTTASALDLHLSLVKEVPYSIGSPEWAAALRSDAKTVATDLERGYIRLGQILYEARTTTVGNVPGGAPIFTTWGFKDFDDWVTQELGLHEHKATSLMRIYRRLVVEMRDLDPAVRERILRLGWTKVREVSRVLTVKNALQWAQLGETANYHDFRRAVSKHADDLQQQAIDTAKADIAQQEAKAAEKTTVQKAAGPGLPADLVNPEGSDEDEMPPVFSTGVGFAADDDAADDAASEVPMPEIQKTIPFNFALYPEQAQVFRDALKMAESHNPGKVKSYYLEVLALEYLANYFAGENARDKKITTIRRLGELLGLSVIARDQETGEVVCGQGTPFYEAIRKGELG